ncbi:MAG: hypothetical protein II855_02535, partial [Candidatus Methanomethylophilaceae archaeon]|nr:hypothetical protein [Candidatus Methanomethylophilaceae archaeon]
MKKINVLLSPVGYDKNKIVTENVTEAIDIESVPVEVMGRDGKYVEIRHVKPDYVYLLLSPESRDNARLIYDQYKGKYPGMIRLCPDFINDYVDDNSQ